MHSEMRIFPRTEALYWLVNIQGLDAPTAVKIAHLQGNNQNPALHYPQFTRQIAAANVGLAFAREAASRAAR